MNRRHFAKSLALGAIIPQQLFTSISKPTSPFFKSRPDDPNQNVWFNYPGRYWNSQSMHIGNGFLGLSFLGGVEEELIAVTEKSLWTGGPGEYEKYQYGIKPGGKQHLAKIRELIVTNTIESLKEADRLVSTHFTGDSSGYGHFSSFGRLSIAFHHAAPVYTNYMRRLDLSSSIATIQYQVEKTTFKREYFCSYPDRIAVLKFSASENNQLSFSIKLNSFQQDHACTFQENVYQVLGKINGNKREFAFKIHVAATSGNVYLRENTLVIENASTVTLLVAGATEYTPVAPLYKGADPQAITRKQIENAKGRKYADLKARHIRDYQNLYNRVTLTLPIQEQWAAVPTSTRWKNYASDPKSDPGLKVLYFNLSRYLLISSSRPGSLPANLQGGWNMFEAAQWSGNYQSNINLQLNYSGACAVNLAECQEPYIDWIKGLVEPGSRVASEYYNSEGWVSHSIGNIWGFAAPGFEIEWGMYPAGAAWHCHFLWKQFVYTQDKKYLRETAYPLLKGASFFWLQNLVSYKGRLIVAPSVSAEHGAWVKERTLFANGSSYGADIANIPGSFQDIEMVYELFSNTIKAAQALETDSELVQRLTQARATLMPLKIGSRGQLQEWEADIDTPECNHRHIGHLYGLWPGKQITASTKELAQAAKTTLTMRGHERNTKNVPYKDIYTAGNWSLALRMICWIRLQEAERANQLFSQIITQAGFENLMTFQQITESEQTANKSSDIEYYQTAEGYWYPVWQIDTSLAIAGFVSEMLLQTNEDGHLILLPGLPDEWPDGKIAGLKAEGNYTVELEWKNKKLTKYRIQSPHPVKVMIQVDGELKEVLTIA